MRGAPKGEQYTFHRQTDYVLSRMQYKEGGEDMYGHFPAFLSGVNHVITWGKNAKNMSPTIGIDADKTGERNLMAMQMNGIQTDIIVRINPSLKIPDDQQILELTKDTLPPKGDFSYDTGANFVYTSDPKIAAIVRPADCTVSVIRGTTYDGKPVLGLLHAGREHLDAEIPSRAIKRLLEIGVDPQSLQIGVTPSMEDYFIPAHTSLPRRDDAMVDIQKWVDAGLAWIQHDENLGKREWLIYLDTLGMLLHQFKQAGVELSPKHLRVYAIDTFKSEGEGFSHRRATMKNTPNGRFLVAAQLAA